jgi:hypothetical protein
MQLKKGGCYYRQQPGRALPPLREAGNSHKYVFSELLPVREYFTSGRYSIEKIKSF